MWPTAQLSQGIADVVRGVTFSQGDTIHESREGFLPVLRAGNIAERLETERDLVWVPDRFVSDRQRLRKNDIVMCTSSGSALVVGKTAIAEADFDGSWGAFNAVLRSTSAVVPRFLYYWLQSNGFKAWRDRQAKGANIQNIRHSELANLAMPFPAKSEQSRIVELLDEADRLRHLRREADTKAARILPALFLKMFGDPATNPKGLPFKLLGDPAVCDINPRTRVELPDSDLVSFVPMADVDEHLGRITGCQSRPYGEVKKGFTPFQNRDVLFAKITPCMQNGKAAIAAGLIGGIGFGSTEFHVLRAGSDVTPEYLFALVRLQSFRNHAMSAFTGSAGQQRVPTEFLRRFRLPIPTSNDVQKFSGVISHLLACQIEAEHAADKLETQFQLLLQRAFSGQLTSKWREAHMQELLTEMAQQARALNLALPNELEALS